MTQKTPQLFKGRDWSTRRYSVAEALNALDHIRDLSLYGNESMEKGSQAERFAILQALHGLVENLAAQCAIAQADVIPPEETINASAPAWLCFEIDQNLLALKDLLLELAENASSEVHGEIAFLADEMKAALKRLDQ